MFTGLGIDEFFQRNDVNGAQSYLSDALQSTLALTNSLGTVTTSYTYEPFGNVSVSPSQTNTNPYQFTGRENDVTRLYYYRARYYSSTYERFVAQHPIGFSSGDVDLYRYVFGDPLKYADPDGEDLNDWTHFRSYYQHISRNRFNHCPTKEPKHGECGFVNNVPGENKYRNETTGDECAYDSNGDLLPDDPGNYTYNYTPQAWWYWYIPNPSHVWQDVVPHFLYGGDSTYVPGLTTKSCGCN